MITPGYNWQYTAYMYIYICICNPQNMRTHPCCHMDNSDHSTTSTWPQFVCPRFPVQTHLKGILASCDSRFSLEVIHRGQTYHEVIPPVLSFVEKIYGPWVKLIEYSEIIHESMIPAPSLILNWWNQNNPLRVLVWPATGRSLWAQTFRPCCVCGDATRNECVWAAPLSGIDGSKVMERNWSMINVQYMMVII